MLVESVPNVSEGRRLDVVERLAEAISSVPGAALLDRTSDASHNSSVFTLAGEHEAVSEALERLVAGAIHEIDMDAHEGEHPRIGAVDVIPFIPLGTTTIEDCIDLARSFGERIATRFDLPVYLYARAAQRPDREKLADVRRGQYEALKEEIGQRGREPDLGPPRMHPSAGAVAVGARPFLIAYNINLDSRDVELAKRISRRVRESGGGLPKVQANGFWIGASSNENSTLGPANAVDGNLSTRWSSGFSDPQWIRVDLGQTYNISHVTLNWEAAYGRAYQIQTSPDGNTWTTIFSTTTGDGGTDDLAVTGTGRYIRMYGTQRATQYGYSLFEFQVYGT